VVEFPILNPDGKSAQVYVYYYLSKDAAITYTDTYIGLRNITSGVPGGAGSSATTLLTIPNSMAPGIYYIGAIVDPANNLREDDETNNARATLGTVVVY